MHSERSGCSAGLGENSWTDCGYEVELIAKFALQNWSGNRIRLRKRKSDFELQSQWYTSVYEKF